jgi:integrase
VSVYKRGNIYHYEFQFENQTYRGTTKCTDQRKAEAHERAVRAEVEAGERRNVAGHSVKDIFAAYWLAHGKKLKWGPTLSAHMDGLERFFGPTTRFADITTKVVSDALDAYAATTERKNRAGTIRPGSPSDSTVNRRLAAFRQIYLWVRDVKELPVGHVNFTKLTRKEPGERVRHITAEQARDLLKRLEEHPHIWLMAAFSLATGCRLDETETLRWDRVNYETKQAEAKTKGGGTRFVNLSAEAIAILALCDRNRVLVFDSTNRRKIWEAALAGAGIDDFRWHDQRHTFATWLGNRVGDIAVVMKALGHSQIQTTMRYRHVIRADVQAGVEKLPALLEGPIVALRAQGSEKDDA